MGKVNNKVDESLPQVGLWERACLFFNKYSKKIYIGSGIIFLVIGILLISATYSSLRLEKMRRDYTNLTDGVSKRLFVKKYGRGPLTGIVLLDLGNDASSKKDYKSASAYYRLAKKAFGREVILSSRAKILRAMALFQSGDRKRGFDILDKMIRSKSLDKNLRAEAAYRHICCATEGGETEKIDKIAQYVKNLNAPLGWQKRIEAELGETKNTKS